jgi:hypothetical protein
VSKANCYQPDQPKQIFQCAACPKRFVRKDLLRRHERRHEKGMWFRNSGGVVAEGDNDTASLLHDSTSYTQESPQRTLESTAMFTDREQEDDVRMSDPSVKMLPYEQQPTETYGEQGPTETYGQMNEIENMHVSNTDFLPALPDQEVTSLFFDPSITMPDPALDFEWLFDNLSADLNNPAGMTSVVSPQSSVSLPGISPPAFGAVQSPVRIRHSISSQSSGSSPWAEVRANLLKALDSLTQDVLMSSFFYPNNLAGFWDLYFENYHPHFPILHKPTLDPVSASPLQVAAIVTLGSTLSGDAGHFDVANKIHDSLRYIIFGVRFFVSFHCVSPD